MIDANFLYIPFVDFVKVIPINRIAFINVYKERIDICSNVGGDDNVLTILTREIHPDFKDQFLESICGGHGS